MNTKKVIAIHEQSIRQIECIDMLNKRISNALLELSNLNDKDDVKRWWAKAHEKYYRHSIEISQMAKARIITWHKKNIDALNSELNTK